MPFDYAIFIDSKLYGLIEVDGEQHYNPYSFNSNKSYEEKLQRFEYIKQHDNIKDNYCKRNKIRLLRIPYYNFNSKNDYKNKINNFLNI